MTDNCLQTQIAQAAKWSSATEIAAKLIHNVTNMLLARILSPEAFGVAATVSMVISFADMFSDAGFQKYLVQREFQDDREKSDSANAAFWTNLGVSCLLWAAIAVFREPVATLVGNPGLGLVIAVACVQLPLTSFSSVQAALYRRGFDFRTLFLVRIVGVSILFCITVPLACLGFRYWAIIVGAICVQLSNAVLLTMRSEWKPRLTYSLAALRQMLSFSMWSLLESISIWLTAWVDAFVIAGALSDYYLGLYKTSTAMVNALMSLITASVTPVLFSALSRLQSDDERFVSVYFRAQRLVAAFVIPLGVGIYLYRDVATRVLLGSRWDEASGIVGIWGVTSAIAVVLGHYSSEVYRAKGRPKLSFLAQVLHLVVLAPACVISSRHGFWPLVTVRSWIRLEAVAVHFLLLRFVIGISIAPMLMNLLPIALSTAAMGLTGSLLRQVNPGFAWTLGSVIVCVVTYLGSLCLFPSLRREMRAVVGKLWPHWYSL